jgi:hypothetical protein
MTNKRTKRVYLAFEFGKDAIRRDLFIQQAGMYCEYLIEDKSIPAAIHDKRWQKEARQRIRESDLVLVLLGQDTHNAPGVKDEVSLAKQEKRPLVQLMPQGQKYGEVGEKIPVLTNKWKHIDDLLNNPREYIKKYEKNK